MPTDSLAEEPFSTFLDELKAFPNNPTEQGLRNLKISWLRLPVRDLLPGQVGTGHPADRDAKLKCALRLLIVLDGFVIDHLPTAYLNLPVEGVPIAGMNPGDVQDPKVRARYIAALKENNANIQILNFQTRLNQTRDELVRFSIPRFMEYDCRTVPAEHLQRIISDELRPDTRAQGAVQTLTQAAGAR